jgi:LAO/AO transport system kinase
MTDFFLLLMLPGAGDELQGIKRGIVEMADAIAINKADRQSEKWIQKAVQEYKSALRLFPSSKSGWQPKLRTCSALEKTGITEIWRMIQSYVTITRENGFFEQNRNDQALHWMIELIHHELREDFYRDSAVSSAIHKTKQEVKKGQLSSYKAARKLLDIYSNTQE